MKLIMILLVVSVHYATCQEQYAVSFLAAQLDQYCKVKNGDFVRDTAEIATRVGKAGPRGRPGFVNYTLIEEMIVKTVAAQINDVLASAARYNQSIAENKEKIEENWTDIRKLKTIVDRLVSTTNTPARVSTTNTPARGCSGSNIEGKCYKVIVSKMTSTAAASACQGIGGKMANIYSSSQYNGIMDYIPQHLGSSDNEILLGMTYSSSNSRVSLSTGETAPFVTWLDGWPQHNSARTQMALRVNKKKSHPRKGMWNFLPTYKYQGVLCEI